MAEQDNRRDRCLVHGWCHVYRFDIGHRSLGHKLEDRRTLATAFIKIRKGESLAFGKEARLFVLYRKDVPGQTEPMRRTGEPLEAVFWVRPFLLLTRKRVCDFMIIIATHGSPRKPWVEAGRMGVGPRNKPGGL